MRTGEGLPEQKRNRPEGSRRGLHELVVALREQSQLTQIVDCLSSCIQLPTVMGITGDLLGQSIPCKKFWVQFGGHFQDNGFHFLDIEIRPSCVPSHIHLSLPPGIRGA